MAAPVSQTSAHHNVAPAGDALMRDGLDAIVQHHGIIRGLISKYKGLKGPQREEKMATARSLIATVSQHASTEERFLYPLAKTKLSKEEGGATLYDMMVTDDQINKELLHFLDTHCPKTDTEWHLFDLTVNKFGEVELSHMDHEETQLISRLRNMLTPGDKARLYVDWEAGLKNAPLKPHPRGPSSGLAASLLHPVAGMVDRAVNMATGLLPTSKTSPIEPSTVTAPALQPIKGAT